MAEIYNDIGDIGDLVVSYRGGKPASHGGTPSSLDGFCEGENANLKWARGYPGTSGNHHI